MEALLKKHAEKLRFAIVGGANTALDFAILFFLVFLGLDKIAANFISTSIAFVFSFFVNKSFTFKATTETGKKKQLQQLQQLGIFLGISIVALWVIQPLIIAGVTAALLPLGVAAPVALFVAKIIATIGSMIWNFILYKRFVFKTEA